MAHKSFTIYNLYLITLITAFILLAVSMPVCSIGGGSVSKMFSWQTQHCPMESLNMGHHLAYFEQLLEVVPVKPLFLLLAAALLFVTVGSLDIFGLSPRFYYWLKFSNLYFLLRQPFKMALARGLIHRRHLD